jgi:hypothetical protein
MISRCKIEPSVSVVHLKHRCGLEINFPREEGRTKKSELIFFIVVVHNKWLVVGAGGALQGEFVVVREARTRCETVLVDHVTVA